MKYLADRKIGHLPLLEVLRRAATGESFELAFQKVTGYTIDRLDAEYRSTVPSPADVR